ncbi:MaoC/PaaZ C-terminal domain-containing protein [Alteromonas ponticola]|uniref:MaoC/PaaZ C-terminal domain-containing protein n=1 Tax=Alteromonas aquimaris TaxID=2998417 RepID=A0ABT3P3N4_9ALTE|nr:MaoC/PaaZ C-terminal domain-containing protein [Alteromonas aquimaris]MCW8107380.1 MaoC/PaaZ C-terminal domain-containing protein [Alteromonas aquimaris]
MIFDLFCAMLRGGDKQRLSQFKPPPIVAVTATKNLIIDPIHYQSYCALVDWDEKNSLHPLYSQMMSLGLQMQCLADKRNPFPLLGLVHISNDVWQSMHLDRHLLLSLHAKLGELKAHPKGWVIDVIIEGHQQGTCVYRADASYLMRIHAPHVAKGTQKQQKGRQVFWETYQHAAHVHIPDNIGRKYARISNDYNPIHLFTITAKLFGFKQAIAHGMWSLAKCYSLLETDKHETKNIHLNADFLKPVLLPAECVLMKNSGETETQFVLLNSETSEPHIKAKF